MLSPEGRFISRERRHRTSQAPTWTPRNSRLGWQRGTGGPWRGRSPWSRTTAPGRSGLLKAIGPRLGHAFVIGVTGPPGTGKSSLVDRLTESYRKKGLKVGIVAIDPTSPLTGGALLGDRIRMVDHTMDKGVFIRSMASRGWAGGLSGAVADVIQLLDAAGMDIIMVETVGIGQSDTDVVRVAHAVMVVLMPGLGDDVQASKAGLMEIGDVYVVNKADLPGPTTWSWTCMAMARDFKGRNPSVLKVSAAKREGIESVVGVLERIRTRFLSSPSEAGDEIRLRSIKGMITELARRRVVVGPREEGGLEGGEARGGGRGHRLTIDEAADSLLGEGEAGGGPRTACPEGEGPMSLAERLADYSASLGYGDIGDVVREAKKRLLDSLGCAIGALGERPVKAAAGLATERYRADAATILGTRRMTTSDMATFVNGLMVRYFDFNDTYLSKEPAHPSDNISACLSTAEMEGRSGKDLLLAIVLAYEIQCRLCDAASLRARGWDHVCYGLVSSALAAGRLMRLSRDEMTQAVNISLNSHLAMRQVRAGALSEWKGFSFANAARNAVFSALLAREGICGPSPIFEGEMGFFREVSGPFELDTGRFGGRSGEGFKLEETFVKFYPAEYHAQSAISAAIELRKEVGRDPLERIESVLVETHEAGYTILGKDREKWSPETRETADHSLPYMVAAVFARRQDRPRDVLAAEVARPEGEGAHGEDRGEGRPFADERLPREDSEQGHPEAEGWARPDQDGGRPQGAHHEPHDRRRRWRGSSGR